MEKEGRAAPGGAEMNTAYETLRRFRNFRYVLVLEGALVGVLGGVVSVLYRLLIEKVQQLPGLVREAAASRPWLIPLWFFILLLLAGAVTFFVKAEPYISGSGIPQVEAEIHGQIRQKWWKVILYKIAGGAICIGAGLSLGREGPSIQLGGMAAKGFSRAAHRVRIEEKLLITCGASAGLSAAFNAPFAGVLFSLEELHKNFSVEVLLSTMAASVASDFVSRNVFGLTPIFEFHIESVMPLRSYWLILLLGIVLGLLGVLYQKALRKTQWLYGKLPGIFGRCRLAVPFLLAGVFCFLCPEVLGGGSRLMPALTGQQFLLSFTLMLFILKFFFSMASFSSGAPGGIFLPLLVLGALAGGAFGMGAIALGAVEGTYFQNFIILAMAGYFAAIVRAPITGIVLICEMTGSFTQLLSLTLVSLSAYVVADLLKCEPVYDYLLRRLVGRGAEGKDAEDEAKVLLEIPVHHGSPVCGKSIGRIAWPKDCLIVSVRRGGGEVLPKGGTAIHAGDVIVLLSREQEAFFVREAVTELCQTMGPYGAGRRIRLRRSGRKRTDGRK